MLVFDVYETNIFFQLHDSIKNITILNVEQSFLVGVYTEVQIAKFMHCQHSHKSKQGRVKGFFAIMTMLSLNLTTVRKSPANEVVVGLLSFLIV